MKICEYDLRQLDLMMRSLQDYKDTKIPLYNLQANLEFLLSALELSDNDWRQTVSENLFNFEMISADSAEEARSFEEVLVENREVVDTSVNQLIMLVQEKMSPHAP